MARQRKPALDDNGDAVTLQARTQKTVTNNKS